MLSYCQLLTAELETLTLAQHEGQKQQRLSVMQTETPKASKESPSKVKHVPHAKPLANPKTPSPKYPANGPVDDRGICKFFSSPGGSRYGRTCVHPHEQFNPSDNRCFNCGAAGHSMQECDKPGKLPPKLPAGVKMAGHEQMPAVGQSAPTAKAGGNRRKPKGRKLEAAPGGAAAPGESPATFESTDSIEQMLKAFSCDFHEPHMVATLKGIEVGKAKSLLDGGATHSLRYAAPSEYGSARAVQVHLASGSTFDLRMNAVGTILSEDPEVQPIVPMGLLAEELGCTITWKGRIAGLCILT